MGPVRPLWNKTTVLIYALGLPHNVFSILKIIKKACQHPVKHTWILSNLLHCHLSFLKESGPEVKASGDGRRDVAPQELHPDRVIGNHTKKRSEAVEAATS